MSVWVSAKHITQSGGDSWVCSEYFIDSRKLNFMLEFVANLRIKVSSSWKSNDFILVSLCSIFERHMVSIPLHLSPHNAQIVNYDEELHPGAFL